MQGIKGGPRDFGGGAAQAGDPPCLASSWALPTAMLWEAGERAGSACAIEVDVLRPQTPIDP